MTADPYVRANTSDLHSSHHINSLSTQGPGSVLSLIGDAKVVSSVPCPEAFGIPRTSLWIAGPTRTQPNQGNMVQVTKNGAGSRGRTLPAAVPWLTLVLLGAGLATGCADRAEEPALTTPTDLEAVQIWAHPDSVGIEVYTPLDFKAASREVAWAIDRIASGVLRYEPAVGKHGVFGFLDNPPAEVVAPARLAVAENTGIFVFDDSTGMVDLYSPGGQHLTGFDPGMRPSIFEVSRQPLALTFGVRTFLGDSIPTLTVVQTDFRGQDPDTLLSRTTGPETLRDVPAVGGQLVSTAASGGLWVFTRTATDTVFEVSRREVPRKLVLPEADTLRVGVLADLQQEILWVVSPRPTGGLDYEAYDIATAGEDGIIDGAAAYLGARTTPLSFLAQVTFDGSVSGWYQGERNVYSPRAYDLRMDELRAGADAARATRTARRAAIADEWTRVLAAVEEARKQELQEMEAIQEEEAQ